MTKFLSNTNIEVPSVSSSARAIYSISSLSS